MEHYELVQEMGSVERMTTQDRLKHARKRRTQQLKKFGQYERQLDKESTKKKKNQDKNAQQKRPKKSNKGRVIFAPNIALLEAAARNDLTEGGWTFFIYLFRGFHLDLDRIFFFFLVEIFLHLSYNERFNIKYIYEVVPLFLNSATHFMEFQSRCTCNNNTSQQTIRTEGSEGQKGTIVKRTSPVKLGSRCKRLREVTF